MGAEASDTSTLSLDGTSTARRFAMKERAKS